MESAATLLPGQTFYEGPDDVHIVGRNASQHGAGEVPGVFREGQGRTDSDARQVTCGIHRCEPDAGQSNLGMNRMQP